MKKIVLIIFCCYLLCASSFGAISGKIDHNDLNYKNKIINSKTNEPLSGAKISIPELNYTTYSDSNGCFKLNADIDEKTVLFVEKDGYKTFSLTVDNSVFNSPLKLGIEESSPFDMQISQGIIHLGDNMYSNNSANSSDFRLNANGHYLSKTFAKPKFSAKQDVVIRIGTIIGLDTKKAKQYGQNRIVKVYSAPSEVFVNGHKIAKLELNGDNIEINIPKNILKETNELVIKSGKNLFQTSYTDYDDIELANLRIEVKEKSHYARR
ncbi:carboxypeptidase-like regulatory domain-containing protein [bacterium]|nr:carboxypeptidase-like regulatory domain-containing protein [bacterium]